MMNLIKKSFFFEEEEKVTNNLKISILSYFQQKYVTNKTIFKEKRGYTPLP
jgi:hypothetical protein